MKIKHTNKKKVLEMGIEKRDGIWLVPSQIGSTIYTVQIDKNEYVCDCPAFELRQKKCKHIRAVEILELNTNIEEYNKIDTTFPQNWRRYNRSQCIEKELFLLLLSNLSSLVSQDEKDQVKGRPPIPKSDMLFCLVYKVYTQFSGRRFTTDLKVANEYGFISKVPHFNSIYEYMKKEELTKILGTFIVLTSLPLKDIETTFAMDSSGFSTSQFKRWSEIKYGRKDEKLWYKVHINSGVLTNIVTAVKITDSNASDTIQFKELFLTTQNNFKIKEQLADKGYFSRDNFNIANSVGTVPYIPFKSNATDRAKNCPIWHKMYYLFQYRRDDFLKHYHKRSNVESTFNMIKSKFNKQIKSKNRTSQINELLCKIICHNIVVLIHEMHELGIDVEISKMVKQKL